MMQGRTAAPCVAEGRRGGRRQTRGWTAAASAVALVLGGLVILGDAVPAGASDPTIFYVAQGATGTACAETAPCGTVSAAVNLASPGDTVEVAGTVDDHVTVTSSQGTPGDLLTIEQWPSQATAVIDGTDSGTVVTVESGAGITLDGVTVTGGSATTGGGVYNDGALTVESSTLSGNKATFNGGSYGGGGGINNRGTLTVESSTLSGNKATLGHFSYDSGGAIFNNRGTVTVEGSTVSGNTSIFGGGIWNDGTLTVERSTVSGNTASAGGGGVGGGITNNGGTVTVEESTLSGNSAAGGGGVHNSGTLTVDDSTLSGNSTSAGDGTDGLGGGIWNEGNLTVESSTLWGNSATTNGSSIFNIFGTVTLAGNILAAPTGPPKGGECSGAITDDGFNVADDDTCKFTSKDSVTNSTTIDTYLASALVDNGGPTETIALLAGAAPGDNPAQAVIPSTFALPSSGQKACSQPDQRGVTRATTCDMGAYALSTATVYATAATPAVGADCTTTVLACSLATALAKVAAGGTVELITPGTTGTYDGGFTVDTPGSSATEPVTIEAMAGVTDPTLSGGTSERVLTIHPSVTLILSGLTITDGRSSVEGGGISNQGSTLTVEDSTISGNTATNNSGGNDATGGGIFNTADGTLTVKDSTFSGNKTTYGGAIYNFLGTATVEDSTLSGNKANDTAGGIFNHTGSTLTVEDSTISGNKAHFGAGIFNDGTSTVEDSTVSGNTATTGGGIFNGTTGGTLTVEDSTISGNTATYGGGIKNWFTGTIVVEGSTISGNTATVDGGGILNSETSDILTLEDSTLSGNSATYGGGITNFGPVTLAGDLLAGATSGAECYDKGTITDDGYNVAEDSTCDLDTTSPGTSVVTPDAKLLDSLGNYGGLTETVPLKAGNPAIGLIPSDTRVNLATTPVQLCPTTDQRGVVSVTGKSCDAGAVQLAQDSIDFPNPGTQTYGTSLSLSATTASGLPVAFASTTPSVCIVTSDGTLTLESTGTCTIDAVEPGNNGAGMGNWLAATQVQQTFTVAPATPSNPHITNLPTNGTYGGSFTATVTTTGDGTKSVTSSSTGVCTVSGLVVTYVGVGTCLLTAKVAAGTDYAGATGTAQSFPVNKATPSTPVISNLPMHGTYGGGFTATVTTTGDGTKSVTSNSTSVCTVSGLVVSYVGVGMCSLTPKVAEGTDYNGAIGSPQSFTVAKANSSVKASVSPGLAASGESVTYSAKVISPAGTPSGSVSFSVGTTPLCEAALTAGTSSCTATNAPVGNDTVTASYGGSTLYAGATGTTSLDVSSSTPPPAPSPPPVTTTTSGYDLVGADGGVFVFPTGSSGGFYGSLPGLGVHLNDIVGMVPTSNDQGYFLVGADGGVFSFGNAPFLGSLPGLGVTPAQPITGIVPTGTDGGYFLVGKDGGVYAFGNAPFLGSLPGDGVHADNIIGIAATPSGNGYWVVSRTGTVYAFGAAKQLGSATGSASPISAIAGTPTGGGYWLVTQNGSVDAFGNASYFGSLPGLGVTPAKPVIGIVHTAVTGGYWLIGSDGGIFAFGNAGFVGSLPGLGVNVSDIVGAVPTGG